MKKSNLLLKKLRILQLLCISCLKKWTRNCMFKPKLRDKDLVTAPFFFFFFFLSHTVPKPQASQITISLGGFDTPSLHTSQNRSASVFRRRKIREKNIHEPMFKAQAQGQHTGHTRGQVFHLHPVTGGVLKFYQATVLRAVHLASPKKNERSEKRRSPGLYRTQLLDALI